MAPPGQPTSGRAESALQAVAAIERKFGAGAVVRLGDVATPTTDVLQTGLIDLDGVIGIGGWRRGRICEVFGPESVGVSTLLLQTLAAAQQRGGIVALVDVDHAFGPEYARRLGCTVEEVFIAQPDEGPMALEIVDALVRSGAFDAVALDSVPALYRQDKDAPENGASIDAPDRARLLHRCT
jgi:recombination protein RecA